MKSFNSEAKLKKDLLKEIKKHEKADEIAQGSYESRDGKGKLKLCAVGCALHSLNAISGKHISPSDHGAFEPELGIPRIIARLADRIFEGLELKEAKKFPYQFINAIPVGADLSLVYSRFIKWLLLDEKDGVIKFAKTDRTREAIQRVGDLYTLKIDGVAVETKDWESARKNAYAAYADAAATTADAAYADAAYAAATTAAYADAAYATTAAYADAAYATTADAAYADAAYAAYADAAYAAYADAAATTADATRNLAWHNQKEKLIQLLKECN